jgi:hypothetical protein
MKFMIEYKILREGLTYEQRMANAHGLLNAFAKWQPEDGLKVLAFVARLTGTGGFVLTEAPDIKIVQSFVSKFVYWMDVEVSPVLDVGESVGIAQQGLVWAEAAAKA